MEKRQNRTQEVSQPESQLRTAYNRVMESGLTYFWDRRPIPGVNPDDPIRWYRNAWNARQAGDLDASERWARSARHIATALWHEAKIAWLSHPGEPLPTLGHAQLEAEYHLHESEPAIEARLASLNQRCARILPQNELLIDLRRLISRAQSQLESRRREPAPNESSPSKSTPKAPPPAGIDHRELIQAERLKAAHEYTLCLDCLIALAESKLPAKVA